MKNRIINKHNSIKEKKLDSGCCVAAIGGGTGLSAILRGLKTVTNHVSAIVTVTDNGGSSGRLRPETGMIPPGDIRNCLAALSPSEDILCDMFSYRFTTPKELEGHSLGNLMLAGLADLTGDMAMAIDTIGKILNIKGRVIPVTLDNINLGAVMSDGRRLIGQTTIVDDPMSIRSLFLEGETEEITVNQAAIDAILDADVVLLGPGSLYTSVIPNLLVPGILEALVKTEAPVWYVANIMTQRGETEGYNLSDHIRAVTDLCEENFLTGVVVNTKDLQLSETAAHAYLKNSLSPLELDFDAVNKMGLTLCGLPLAVEDGYVKHDGVVLAEWVASLYNEK